MSNLVLITDKLLQRSDLKDYLIMFLGRFYALANQQADAKNLLVQADLLINEVNAYFPTLTTKDFENAMHKGIRGEYGEFKGSLSILSYNKWIKAYKAANIAPSVEPKAEVFIPNETERQKITREWEESIIRQFHKFKQDENTEISMPAYQYKEFVSYGLLKENDYLLYVDAAKRHILEKKRLERLNVTSTKRIGLNEQIKRIEKGEGNGEDNALIIQQAQIDCLKDYFRSIKELKFR